MAEETKQGLSAEELEAQSGEALPDREAMSVVWIEPDVPLPEGGEGGPKGLPVDSMSEPDQDSGPLQGGETL